MQPFIETDTEIVEKTVEKTLQNLVVFNDEVNTFDWVIETLMDVCKHSATQAEQCTLIIHFKGKCKVKE